MKRKNIFGVILTLMMLFLFSLNVNAASWPSFSASKPVKTYTISSGNNTPAYSNSNLNSKSGTIYASDELFIANIGRNSRGTWYCYLTYPTSRGRRSGYVPLSTVTSTSSPSEKYTSRAKLTTYRRPGSRQTAGSISNGDTVYQMGSSGSYTQVLYNIGSTKNPSGWRMAWITTSNFNKYVKSGYNPQGNFDGLASNASNCISVYGWAFDRDNLNTKLAVHIYVGGPAGSGAPGYAITANTYRPDVNRVYSGVGNYHGFSSTIRTNRTGKQTVYAYAINTGLGDNVFIGSRTVDIKGSSTSSPTTTTKLSEALYKNSRAYISCKYDGYVNTKGRHEGIDFNCYNNAPVYSLIDGTVIRVKRGYNGSNGLSTIAIYDSAANKTVIYLHSNPLSSLKAGQTVKKGQQIATQGWRGVSKSSGSHTHVEVRDGRQMYAAKSVNDYRLENKNPESYWKSKGYTVK